MHFLYSHFSKKIILLICFCLTIPCLSRTSSAQYDEEMKILRLFYKEKDLVVSPTRHPKPISRVARSNWKAQASS